MRDGRCGYYAFLKVIIPGSYLEGRILADSQSIFVRLIILYLNRFKGLAWWPDSSEPACLAGLFHRKGHPGSTRSPTMPKQTFHQNKSVSNRGGCEMKETVRYPPLKPAKEGVPVACGDGIYHGESVL